jgi:hypothetical protein
LYVVFSKPISAEEEGVIRHFLEKLFNAIPTRVVDLNAQALVVLLNNLCHLLIEAERGKISKSIPMDLHATLTDFLALMLIPPDQLKLLNLRGFFNTQWLDAVERTHILRSELSNDVYYELSIMILKCMCFMPNSQFMFRAIEHFSKLVKEANQIFLWRCYYLSLWHQWKKSESLEMFCLLLQ